MSNEREAKEIVRRLHQLSLQNEIDEIIELLRSKTRPEGPLHPNNEKELNIWNLPGYHYFLRRGKYKEAEKIYRAFYASLLEHQNTLGRLHKGMPLQNLALSLFFQGKTDAAIKFLICAYIEDVIRGKGAESVEMGAASRVLRGFCGVPQEVLLQIRDITLQITNTETLSRPELIYDSPRMRDLVSGIQGTYREHIPKTWKWEKDGQLALEKGNFGRSFEIYQKWFTSLLSYQEAIGFRVHKGHPLFNLGLSSLLKGKAREALDWFLLAYIEDVISAFQPGDADVTSAFRNLSARGATSSLREMERVIFDMKHRNVDLSDPRRISGQLAKLQKEAKKGFKNQRDGIASALEARNKSLAKKLSKKTRISSRTNNTLYIMKRWNSASPRYPPEGETPSLGGGYFLLWNKKGIVIDPGYDFLKIFNNEGFYVRNIDLIIITHAHDDHCQDFEAISSVLYKLNRWCRINHKIDLVISEAVHIKYERLLTIMKDFVNSRILLQNDVLDPSTISGTQYNLKIQATKTDHGEEPWMKNNTGFGLVLSVKEDRERVSKIGITGDTANYNGIHKEFSGVDLLVEHIGTYGKTRSGKHLSGIGCSELLKLLRPPPRLVVVSEFGEELKGFRADICTQIETIANRHIIEQDRFPVFAGDIGLKIKIPTFDVFCNDTSKFERFTDVMDKEIDGKVVYLKRE